MPLRHLITLIANIHQNIRLDYISRKTSFSRYNRWRGQAANHNARLEQALATLIIDQSDYIFSSLFHTEQANHSKRSAITFLSCVD